MYLSNGICVVQSAQQYLYNYIQKVVRIVKDRKYYWTRDTLHRNNTLQWNETYFADEYYADATALYN